MGNHLGHFYGSKNVGNMWESHFTKNWRRIPKISISFFYLNLSRFTEWHLFQCPPLRLGFFRIQAKGLFDFWTPVTSWHPRSGEHRPLPMVGSGGPAASTFCESLADADAAALKRLRFAQYNFSIMLGGLVNVCIFVPAYTETLLHTFIRCLSPK